MSEDALSRAARMNARLAQWQKQVAGESANAPLRVVGAALTVVSCLLNERRLEVMRMV
jgi:hypothetical protein